MRGGEGMMRRWRGNEAALIYCVIPRELEDELFEKLTAYYRDNPNVSVIVDRRLGPDRRRARAFGGMRALRDRRRQRPIGSFPTIDLA
jgi:hypothetical protein